MLGEGGFWSEAQNLSTGLRAAQFAAGTQPLPRRLQQMSGRLHEVHLVEQVQQQLLRNAAYASATVHRDKRPRVGSACFKLITEYLCQAETASAAFG